MLGIETVAMNRFQDALYHTVGRIDRQRIHPWNYSFQESALSAQVELSVQLIQASSVVAYFRDVGFHVIKLLK